MKKQAHLLRGALYLLLFLLPYLREPIRVSAATRYETKAQPSSAARTSDEVRATEFAANIIVVTNTNDSGPGSLRDALAIANDGDTIDIRRLRHHFS